MSSSQRYSDHYREIEETWTDEQLVERYRARKPMSAREIRWAERAIAREQEK